MSDWKFHKRFCSDDASLRPFVAMEAAIERALELTKTPSSQEAVCYVCLEGPLEKKEEVTRECGCRGESAGFVHFSCLAELAGRSGDGLGYFQCITCKQSFGGSLGLQMSREAWRRSRNDKDNNEKTLSARARWTLALALHRHSEHEAGYRLDEELASERRLKGGELDVLSESLREAQECRRFGFHERALTILEDLVPRVKVIYENDKKQAGSYLAAQLQVVETYVDLKRTSEALKLAETCTAFAFTHFGHQHAYAHLAQKLEARAAGLKGLFERSRILFANVLKSQTRLYGPDHELTLETHKEKIVLKCLIMKEAQRLLKENKKTTDASRYLDSVLLEDDDDLLDSQHLLDDKNNNADLHFTLFYNIVAVQNQLKRFQDAAPMACLCVDFATRRYGLEASKTHLALHSFAFTCYNLDRLHDAHEILTELLPLQAKTLGRHHTTTKDTADFLKTVRAKLDDDTSTAGD